MFLYPRNTWNDLSTAGAEFGPDSVCWLEELGFPELALAWWERDWVRVRGAWQPPRMDLVLGLGQNCTGWLAQHMWQGDADTLITKGL